LTDVTVGDYKVSFGPPGGATQFYHLRRSFETADVVTVPAGETALVDEAALPHSSVSGGDEMAGGRIRPRLPGATVRPQTVKVQYLATVRFAAYEGFIGGVDFADATVNEIPTNGTTIVDISATNPVFG
jgi:hypothetical protein